MFSQQHISSLCQSIRTSVDLVAVANQDVSLRRTGLNEWRGRNPFHGGDNPTGFAVYYDRGDKIWRFKCFTGAGYQGDVIDYVRARDGLNLFEAIERLSGGIGIGEWESRKPIPDNQALTEEERSRPLSWRLVDRYEGLLDLPIDPSGRNAKTPRELWHQQGLDDATIARFRLGFCPACPTAYDESDPDRRFSSLTIPVTFNGELLAIRHRLLTPINPKDKYRPHRKGSGLHLFNRDSLSSQDSDVLIVEGEKKAMVLCGLGFETMMPIVSTTGGVKSWVGRYRGVWAPLLAVFDRVYVLFDPGSEEIAERTAFLFGRRGHVVVLPKKVDDLVLSYRDPCDGVRHVIETIAVSAPVRSRSYWGERLATLPDQANEQAAEALARAFSLAS